MYNATDPSYIQARAIKKDLHQLLPAHKELIDWVSRKFGVSILDFICETKQTSAGYKQQVLILIPETEAEAQKLEPYACQQAIVAHFMPFFLSADPALKKSDVLKSDVFSPDSKPFPETIVGYHSLERVALKEAAKKAREEDPVVFEKYKDLVWTSNFPAEQYRYIFYYTDAQLKANRDNGINKAILNDLLSVLKKHDEFGYFGLHSLFVYFDSKETFERDYSGNWYYYYK
jgi:hypothetical protein